MKYPPYRFSAILAVALLSALALPATAANMLKFQLSGLRVTPGGSGVTPPAVANLLAADKATIPFGDLTVVGATAQNSVTVTNNGATVVTVGAPSVSAGASSYFVLSNGCTVALNPNDSCVVTVSFAPLVAGAPEGTLTIPSSADNSSLTVSLAGSFSPPSYAVLDATRLGSGLSLSQDFLTVTNVPATGNWKTALGTTPKSSGKYYFEVLASAYVNGIGIAGTNVTTAQLEGPMIVAGVNSIQLITFLAEVRHNGTSLYSGPAYAQNSTIGVAVDMTANTIQYFAKPPNQACRTVGTPISISMLTAPFVPALSFTGTSSQPWLTANFGQSAFACAVPAGFAAGWY